MSGEFHDHFAPVAQSYAQFRPSYPEELYLWLASRVMKHDLAWDCAAGSGQASIGLTPYFSRVIATDASRSQIEAAVPAPRIEYRVAPAENSGLPDSSADLITVAQALHWFDLDAFYREARRVLHPGGLLAVWTYGVLMVQGDSVNPLLQTFYHDIVGPYWPEERMHVETGYRDLPFPFQEQEPPAFSMTAFWTLSQLLGYIRSWSATGRYMAAKGHDPVAVLENRLAPAWGDPTRKRRISWPLALRVGTPRNKK